MRPWWIRLPERLEHEKQALDAIGATYVLDENARARAVLRLNVHFREHHLVAEYPDLYPFFRPQVFAPDLTLTHHQNPVDKNLCLLGRATDNWRPRVTLADLLEKQLPEVLRTGAAGAPVEGEERQAEPISEFFRYERDAIVYVEGDWPAFSDGCHLLLGLAPSVPPFRAAVLGVVDLPGREISLAPEGIADVFPRDLTARCIRLPGCLEAYDAESILRAAGQARPELQSPEWQRIAPEGDELDVIALVYPEETGYRTNGEGCAFVVRFRRRERFRRRQGSFLARTVRMGRMDLEQRLPEMTLLRRFKVAVLGLGCLGATCALEIARAGVGSVRLVDHDFVEGGTAVRWPFGLTSVGRAKTEVIEEFIRANYPHVHVLARNYRIGGVGDLAVFAELLDDADLIIDATVEEGIHHALAQYAADMGKHLVLVAATNGGYGGRIARFSDHGCWLCLEYAIAEGRVIQPEALPDSELVQPAGCASPTYLGGSFDLGEISLAGVRLAISTLCKLADPEYPDFEWDVGVVNLRSPEGRRIAPAWSTYRLSTSDRCDICGPPPV